jgi:hypothetical protein
VQLSLVRHTSEYKRKAMARLQLVEGVYAQSIPINKMDIYSIEEKRNGCELLFRYI